MSYILYGMPDNLRVRLIRVVALYEGIDLKLQEANIRTRAGIDNTYFDKFPHSQGKIPAFEGPGIKITETVAIAHYLASISNKARLLGSSKEEAAEVLQWTVFATSELLTALADTFLHLPPFNLPYNKDKVSLGEKKLQGIASALEKILLSRTYLVGERITLADIFLAQFFSTGFESALDASWRSSHPNIVRHCLTVAHQPHFLSILGKELVLVEKKPEYTPPKKEKAAVAAPASSAPKSEKKKAKKGDDDDEEEPDAPAEPAPKHPCEALGRAKCFPIDEWKRQYSNSEFSVAMKWLEDHIDLSEYSFWRVTYKYNDELTQIFMSGNLIGGFHNRLEASRKYLFGSAGVYGKANASKIQGAYMIRGSDHKAVFDVAPDWESYEIEPLDFKKDIDFIKGCWNWDNTFDGLEYADGKVFK